MNLNQVTIPVSSIVKSVDYYQRLGLRLIVRAEHYARFECPDGDSTFSLHQAEASAIQGHAWIYFEHENLDKYVAELQEKGIEFEELPEDKPWLWREARLRDPDGHVLILYYAGKNRKDPPWRLAGE